ncbi:MAG: restriction endonuclease subunit S [Lactobacillus iners]|nr:restriction endonuclease subunit S [Lactobacillus iners]
METWKTMTLSDVCYISSSKRIFAKEYQSSGIPFYRGKEIIEKHNGISISNKLFISSERYEEIKNKFGVPLEGDILLTSVGTLGIPWLVDKEKFYFKDGNLTWLRNNELITPRFLYYWLITSQAQNQINSKCIGSTQKALTIEILKKFYITFPDIKTQKKITSIIESIELKIDNNRKINKNLEEQIRILCNAWLNDYVPFGGICPSDWLLTPLSSFAKFISGYSYKGTELQESSVAMATIKNFDRKGGFKLDGYKEIVPSSKLKPEHHAELFDTLVAHTDLTQNAEVIGNAEPVLSFSGYEDIIFSMDVVRVLPDKPTISKFLIAAMLKTQQFKTHCLGYVNGTTVLHLSKKALPEYSLMLPEDFTVLHPLDEAVSSMYKQMALNIDETVQLTNLRDALLPQLMSGEIDVSNLDL